jgi:predicted dienelactone hydrolase
MASVWYPARDVRRYPVAQWMPSAALRALLTDNRIDPGVVSAPLTAGHERAPVRPSAGRLPIVVYSHAAHDHRANTTIVVQELASHGYAVVTVDHTYDAFSQFPDGRLTVPIEDPGLVPADFAEDIRFVLDRIEDLAAGRDPDVDHRPLPIGLRSALDLRRIGMFGASKGGTATALVMIGDRRVRAGLSLDGPMQTQPPITGELDRPFMMMTAEFTRAADPSAAAFWAQLRGWRLNVELSGATETSYGDNEVLIPQLARIVGMSDHDVRAWIGTVDPARAVRVQQAYPLAFFDRHLRGQHERLLDGPSAAFPEVTFVP